MPKDYVKRSSSKKQEPAQSSKHVRYIVLLVIVVLLVGAWQAYRYYQAKQDTLPPVVDAKPLDAQQGRTVRADNDEPINFEFYSMLPNTKVETRQESAAYISSVDTPGFWIQLGAFFTEETAGDMQQRMQLLGLDPLISLYQSKKTGRDIYRVEIGPYQTYQAAVSKQQELNQMQVQSMIRNAT